MLYTSFKLSKEFINSYKDKKVNFGFNGLGELTYYRTYSRLKADGTNEHYFETVERVVNTIFSIYLEHLVAKNILHDKKYMNELAEEMYDAIFTFKFTPSGRGFWALVPELLEKVGGMPLHNCMFVSTVPNVTKAFCTMMNASMLGVGVGFDTKAENKIKVNVAPSPTKTYVIPDTREGWVKSLKLLINSYLLKGSPSYKFDYKDIRPAGTPIKTFGGIASGAEPLKQLHKEVAKTLSQNAGKLLTARTIVDVMNQIGKCVVSGNVRRTAQIALGKGTDFLNLKNYELNPERTSWGWASNNSLIAELGQDYSEAAKRTAENGEPGYFWIENARKFGRMADVPNYKDKNISGTNPCGEQSLESFEVCTLVETFPCNFKSKVDYLETLELAHLYVKILTLVPIKEKEINEIVQRNRRVGISMSGLAQLKMSKEDFITFCEMGYDHLQFCEKFLEPHISKSIKLTTIKPSGTVSLLAGATPGLHFPESNFYVRRINIPANTRLAEIVKQAGYPWEMNAYGGNSICIEFPIAIEGVKTINDVTIHEQVEMAELLQKYWSDNQVSCTVTFKPSEKPHIQCILETKQYVLKGISFLPKLDLGAYKQMPYQEISQEAYKKRFSKLKPLDFSSLNEDGIGVKFCENDSCALE